MTLELHAQVLRDIFSTNCGFYIPNFQREFTWTKEPAKKLVDDVENTIKIKISDAQAHDFFLGSMIFLRQYPVPIGLLIDDQRLSITINTVIDGQQRLTTLSILASVLEDHLYDARREIEEISNPTELTSRIVDDLSQRENMLRQWQCFNGIHPLASPTEKPLIIRSVDAASLRAVDQWTLCGDPTDFYRSDIALFLQGRIARIRTKVLCEDVLSGRSLVREVAETFLSHFRNISSKFLVEEQESQRLRKLIDRLEFVHGDQDYWPNNREMLAQLSSQQRCSLFNSIYLLLFCDVLMDRTTAVVIKTSHAALAYDMFQSINGTGVPLTTIEVIKPDLVAKFRANYGVIVQPRVTEIEKLISTLASSKPDNKAKITADLICDIARAYEGNIGLTKIFSDQRAFLKKIIDRTSEAECLGFLDLLKNELTYRLYFTRKSADPEQMRTHLIHQGMQYEDADLVTMLILFFNEANHDYAHKIVSIFFSKLASASRNSDEAEVAKRELVAATKSCAAFFALWTGLGQSRHPDSVYKSLFTSPLNITYMSGSENQNSAFISGKFKDALDDVMSRTYNQSFSCEHWIEAFVRYPIYRRKTVAKLILLVAHHDAMPDYAPGRGGLLRSGPVGCAPYLGTRGWTRPSNSQIEHIAVQSPTQSMVFEHAFDPLIYEPDRTVVHRIGNLTFLSGRENPALGQSEWPVKLFFYWSLTNRGDIGETPRDQLKSTLGLSSLPPLTQELSEGAEFVHHLAPIVQFGLENPKWSFDIIELRGRNIGTRAFTTFQAWLS